MRALDSHPLSSIVWLSAENLSANGYNPNVVVTPEMKLLKFSLLKQGWIQPVLVALEEDPESKARKYVIIDGFHRSTLAKVDPEVRAMTNGQVPCCILELTVPERMLLTVRINRAKGSHVAAKMHDMIKSLVNDYGYAVDKIGEEIGATKHEIDTLMLDDVFVAYNSKDHVYSQAWEPVPGSR